MNLLDDPRLGTFACFLAVIFVVVILMVVTSRPRIGSRRYAKLSELVADLSRQVGLPADREPEWYPKLQLVRFEGKLASGRKASVSFFDESVGSSTTTFTRFRVAADEAPHLKVTIETIVKKFEKLVGWSKEIEVGEPNFDDRFLLETYEPDRARRALGPELRKEIRFAFDVVGVRDLLIERGGITVTAPTSSVEPGHYRRLLDALDRIARHFDRKTLNVRVLGGERRALVDDSGKTRCPYCRSGITGEESDLVACEKCSTVLHEGCWQENEGCPILGCTGRAPERARVG